MIYEGTVQGGVVVFPAEVHLPDGLEVVVQVRSSDELSTMPEHLAGTMRNGIPVFPRSDCGVVPDVELVNRLRDELP